MDDLANLNAAATQGVWEFDGNCGGYVTQENGAVRIGRFYAANDPSFTVALVNAYRAGELVPKAELDAMRAEVERLREDVGRLNQPQWLYYGDDCSSDACRDSIHEIINEDFEWDNKPEGEHVFLVSGARPTPDMWIALHYFTEEEKAARDTDDNYTFTEHATQSEARSALGEA